MGQDAIGRGAGVVGALLFCAARRRMSAKSSSLCPDACWRKCCIIGSIAEVLLLSTRADLQGETSVGRVNCARRFTSYCGELLLQRSVFLLDPLLIEQVLLHEPRMSRRCQKNGRGAGRGEAGR